MSYSPNNPNGQATSANSAPIVIASDQSTVPVSGTISVTGGATSANQTNGTQQTQLTDGTHLGTIKAASTAAIATDTSLVIALSPNSPIPTGANTIGAISNTSFIATQATAGNLNATVVGSGNFTVVQATGTNLHTVVDSSALPTGASTSALQTTGNTSLASIVTNTNNLGLAQASTTSGQLGNLNFGAVTTAAPTYTTGQTNPLSLTTTGALRVDSSSTTNTTTIADPVTGTKAQVSLTGQFSTSIDPIQVFNEAFEGGVIDTTNRWNAPVVAGAGTVTQSSANGLVISVGTGANSAGAITSQPTFPTQYASIITFACTVKLETTTIATGNYRFWGLGTQGTSYSTSNPIANGIGFELTTAGVLRAVIYANDVLISSTNCTAPLDGAEHLYVVTTRGNFINWYIDTTGLSVPVAVVTYTSPDITLLPIRFASLNGSGSTTGTPTLTAYDAAIVDQGRNSSQLSDGTYPWRKATISATGALSTTDTNGALTIGTKAPGTAASNSELSGMVYNSTVPTPTNGQQLAMQSDAFGNVSSVLPDMVVTGASAQTATVNNILTAASGASATNLMNYKSASVQVVSTGTGGTFIFEGSNDNVNFQTIPVYSQLILTGTPITTSITATATSLIYTFPVSTQYVRLRIATTITGGSIQAFSRFAQATWTPAIFQVAQATTANLNTTSTIASGTVTTVSTVTASNNAIPGIIADVASAALTTTTTTGTLTPTFGASYTVNIPVTVVSGTNPTLDVQIQESLDSGTNWIAVYDFPRITATGSYNSPPLPFTGNRIRYVQTVAGTTPSFTRAINRLQTSQVFPIYRQMVDRTIAPTSTNSTTATLFTAGASNIQMLVNQGTGGSAVTFAIDGSDDNSNWVQGIAQVVGVIGGATPVSVIAPNFAYKFVRGRVVTGVSSTTISYVTIIATNTPVIPSIQQTSAAQGTLTDGSGTTSGTPSTSTQIFSANSNRKYLIIQNVSTTNTIWINFTSAATTTQPSFQLLPGGSFVQEANFISTEAVNVISTAASSVFTAKQG